jgi:hypothetical protein
LYRIRLLSIFPVAMSVSESTPRHADPLAHARGYLAIIAMSVSESTTRHAGPLAHARGYLATVAMSVSESTTPPIRSLTLAATPPPRR